MQLQQLRQGSPEQPPKLLTMLGGRELFALPTSEIEDLYKEHKEKQDAFKRDFGLIGIQTQVLENPKHDNCAATTNKMRLSRSQNRAHIRQPKPKCPRLVKMENQMASVFKELDTRSTPPPTLTPP